MKLYIELYIDQIIIFGVKKQLPLDFQNRFCCQEQQMESCQDHGAMPVLRIHLAMNRAI